jgi:hypothetical protein
MAYNMGVVYLGIECPLSLDETCLQVLKVARSNIRCA